MQYGANRPVVAPGRSAIFPAPARQL